MEHAKLMAQLDGAEAMCHEYAQIWQNLLEEQNGGYLTRENLKFILGKVGVVIAARKASLMNRPNRVRLASASGEIARKMQAVMAGINTDLELRISRQEAFPKKEKVVEADRPNINVTIHTAANVNLGTQVGTINAALSAISEQGESSQEVVEALKGLTNAVVKNTQFHEDEKRETLEVIEEIARKPNRSQNCARSARSKL